jgi:hypothetical protein
MFSFFRSSAPAASNGATASSAVFSDNDVKYFFETLKPESPSQDGTRQPLLQSKSKDGVLLPAEIVKIVKQNIIEGRRLSFSRNTTANDI